MEKFKSILIKRVGWHFDPQVPKTTGSIMKGSKPAAKKNTIPAIV